MLGEVVSWSFLNRGDKRRELAASLPDRTGAEGGVRSPDLTYLFLQNAGDLPKGAVQATHTVVGPLATLLALKLLQQVFH